MYRFFYIIWAESMICAFVNVEIWREMSFYSLTLPWVWVCVCVRAALISLLIVYIFLLFFTFFMWYGFMRTKKCLNGLSYRTYIYGSVIKLSNQFNQCAEGNPLPYRFNYMNIYSHRELLFFIFSIFFSFTRFWKKSVCLFTSLFSFSYFYFYFLFCLFRFFSCFFFFIPFALFVSYCVCVFICMCLKYTSIC